MLLLFLAVLGLFGWLMVTRRMTATIALPLAALTLSVLALTGVARDEGVFAALSALVTEVAEPGISRLSGAIFAVILGAILAAQLKITGAAERVVRYAAEYAGEDRFRLGLMLLVLIAVLFTTLGGLGAVILVATVTLPLMFSLGFEPKVAGVLFLMGLSLGGTLNPVNWALYISVLEMDTSRIIPYAVVLACLFFAVSIAYLLYEVGRESWQRQFWPLSCIVLVAAIIGFTAVYLPDLWHVMKLVAEGVLISMLAILFLILLIRLLLLCFNSGTSRGWLETPGNWLCAASALVPLVMLLWSNLYGSLVPKPVISIPILTALGSGILFAALASITRDGASNNRLMKAFFDGFTSAGPAVILMIGIGLLLKATTLGAVVQSFQPLMQRLPVANPLSFVLVFLVLAPLALYRGPLNLYGMGSGVVGIISGSAILAPGLVMVAFFSVGMLQGVCDPTNTHNVWIANFCKLPVSELTRASFPWVMGIVLLGLVAGAVMFFGNFA